MAGKEIDELYGEAYVNGIENVASVLNRRLGLSLSHKENWESIEYICKDFNIRFDENGERMGQA